MNAADMLELLRDNINEATAAHWSDVNLVRRINQAQRKVERLVAMSPGQWLVTSASVTPSSSVITLPSDCGRPLYMEEASSGRVITWLGSVDHRRVSRLVGSTLNTVGSGEAYPLMSTIEVNEASYSAACTLWYQIRVPDLHTGVAGANSTTSALHLAADRNRKFVDDYYNDAIVEVIDQTSEIVDVRSTVSDYVASTGIATIVGTAASGDTYGTVSRLPEETHHLILVEATLMALMKPSAVIDKEVLKWFSDELKDTRRDVDAWLGSRTPGQDGVEIGDPY